MTMVELPSRMWGGLVALRIASSVSCLLYLVLAVVDLVSHTHPHVAVTAAFSVASGLVCGVVSRIADRVEDPRTVELLLVVLCLVPLADVLAGIAVLHDITITSLLNVTFLVFGVLTVRWQVLGALLLGGGMLWLLEVHLLGFPADDVRGHVQQLLLRMVLSCVVFKIRDRLDQELTRTGEALDEQALALSRTRELHGRELSRFRSMFHSSPVGIFVSDMDGVILDANEATGRILGVPREQLIGTLAEGYVHPDERLSAEMVRKRRAHMHLSGPISAERRVVRGDGTEITLNLWATAITGPEGEAWVLSHVDDVTSRKVMERDLIRSRDGLRAVADISSASQRGLDPRPVAVAHLERLAGAVHVSIAEPLDDQTLVITGCTKPELRGVQVDLTEQSVSGDVWRSGKPMFIADAPHDPRVNPALLGLVDLTSMMWQPVGEADSRVALVTIGWPQNVATVGAIERDAVRTVAAELGSALVAERLRRQLEERSRVDPLTGLMNRRGWDHSVADMLAQSRRTGSPFVLAVADLDHFKQFNDEFGHLEGDILLSGFAAAANATVRDVDVMARWGGEEFAIALRDCDLSDARPVLERIRAAVPAGRTCSIGFATIRPGESVEECMRRADEALYRAKSMGRDRIEYSHDDAGASAQTARPGRTGRTGRLSDRT
ncbi:diguanylate cyclase [Nocardioides mangrovicus]|uniref:Diguanylate cyclase n=1 Tax=Nocardioides mangrovicus TaxID=2478913 RepID=A0A3L8P5T9_9ACTN|nr:diguanylate cyclase [Nocardioides mangrovicus]RLV50760.1 diguanylate cyclase [Nocardioides mangrovicus]